MGSNYTANLYTAGFSLATKCPADKLNAESIKKRNKVSVQCSLLKPFLGKDEGLPAFQNNDS